MTAWFFAHPLEAALIVSAVGIGLGILTLYWTEPV